MRYILVLALLCPFLSNCQPITLKGKIINEQMEPIAGATITLKRSVNSQPSSVIHQLSSDPKGEFTLSNVWLTDTLIITAIGYETAVETLDFNSRGLVTIILKRRASLLEEVVVNTGYQTLPKERATGSFETLSNHLLNQQTGISIIDRLQGVSSIFFDKNPLRQPLTIRGPSSIMGSKEPLVILDNFPYNGDITNINPADVESVTILKDAAAASIWGTKAGNGVIVINTKKGGVSQPLSIEWTSGGTVTAKPNLFYLPSISSAGFIGVESFLFSKGFRFSDTLSTARTAFSPVYEILFKQKGGSLTAAQAEAQLDALRGWDVRNDAEKYLYRPSFHQQQAVNLKGGSSAVSYYFSAGFDTKTDNLDGTYKRASLRAENNFRLSSRLRLSASLFLTNAWSGSGKPSFEQLRPNLYPYTQLAGINGTPLGLTRNLRQSYIDTAGAGLLLNWNYYPLEDYRHNTTAVNTLDILANTGLQYNFLGSLSLDLKYQYQKQQTASNTLQDEESYYTRDLVNRFTQIDRVTGTVKYNLPPGAIADKTENTITAHSLRSQLAFTKRVSNSSIAAMAGAELRQVQQAVNAHRLYGYNSSTGTVGSVDNVNPYPDFVTGAPSYIPAGTSVDEGIDRFVSLYANASYTWKARYTVSGSARRDASNLFGVSTNNKWQPLWSAGASWALSDESFYRLSFLPRLRFRLTWGFSGNVDQSRSAVTTIGYSGRTATYTNLPFASVSQFANPSLRWEKVATLNMALDFASRQNRLSGSLEYYIKKGTDLFGSSPVDYTAVAAKTVVINVAGMKGSGLELVVNSINTNTKLKWTTALQFNYNTSRVTKYFLASTRGFDHVSNGTRITAITGYPVYAVLSFAWKGLDSLGNPVGIVNKQPTTSYSSIIGAPTQLPDLVYGGPATPPFFGNLSNSFSYKSFTLTAALLYKFGSYFRKESVSYDLLFNGRQGHADFANRWQNPGDEYSTYVPSMIYPNNAARDVFYSNSEVLVRKGDNIRWQFIRLGYDRYSKKQKTKGLERWGFYLVASNLGIIWRANKDGIDPDYGTSVPPSKTIAFGITATIK